ncbi:MAG TPA: hypothetical protein VFW95_07115 [Candidatus Limnocylindria bacterium]|nr:hypothetical protein [Candidatus Limnocylindria bacterium]
MPSSARRTRSRPERASDASPTVRARRSADVALIREVGSIGDVLVERFDPSAFHFPGIIRRPRIAVVRPQDLLVVAFEFRNLSLGIQDTDEGPMGFLRPTGSSPQALVIVHFQPQNIAERAFFETPPVPQDLDPKTSSQAANGAVIKDRDEDPALAAQKNKETPSDKLLPVKTRLAGPSQLAFRVPAGAAIRYTTAGILEAVRGYELNVPATALPPQPTWDFVRPYVIDELTEVVAKAARRRGAPTVEGLRAKARLQRWEDNTELVPITLHGPSDLPRSEVGPAEITTIEGHVIGRIGGDGGGRAVIGLDPGEVSTVLNWLRRHPRLAEPGETETALELPYRLFIAPNVLGAWAHATEPVSSPVSGRFELWHTRLATRTKDADDKLVIVEDDHPMRTVRAVWARSGAVPPNPAERFDPDPQKPPTPRHADAPFRMSLDPTDRFEVVHLSANFNVPKVEGKTYRPQPVEVNRLMLASLGAWIDSRGGWDPPKGMFEVEEWRHRGTMARDHYVRVVYRGYLWPFGHRASVIKVTERKFHASGVTGNPAILRQRMYLVVRQPLLTYGEPAVKDKLKNPQGHLYAHQFPFTQVRITSLVTPNLDPPEGTDYPAAFSLPGTNVFNATGEKQSLFWPFVGGAHFPFHVVAEDLESRKVEFTAPLLFVSNVYAWNTDTLTKVKDHYEKTVGSTLGTVQLNGQSVALAPPDEPGDTMFEATSLELGVEIPSDGNLKLLGPDRPRFYPRVRTAKLVVPVLKQFTGNEQPVTMSYSEPFLKSGFPDAGPGHPNDGQIFLQMAGPTTSLDFSGGGDKAGAFVQPNLSVNGLSRSLGPVGGGSAALANLATGAFDPASFFDPAKARLFGVVSLGELIEKANVDTPDLVPKFVTEAVAGIEAFTRQLSRLQASLASLKSEADAAAGLPAAVKAQATALQASVTTHVGQITTALDKLLDGADATADLTAAITALHTDLEAASALIGTMGPAVSADARKTLQSAVDGMLADIGGGAAAFAEFAARLEQARLLAEELTMRFDWKPTVKDWPDPGGDQAIFRATNTKSGNKAVFSIAAELQAKTKLRKEPRVDVACRLHNFTLNLIGEQSFILLHFNKLEFTAKSGTKPDVNVEFDDIEFTGVLSFVETLRTLIPLDGFSDPPALQVSEKGISASYSMALPDIAVGVFTLQNLSLGAGFNVPFLLDPLTVRFNFCERESPFLLTVSMFGGGGFFAITLDPDGVEILEASFEFGASVSVNFGVASGGITVMAGIYYKMEIDEATLTGYLRMAGEVDVLGLISACIELYLGLAYEFASGKCAGKATITVEVSVAFFETDVSISAERKFAGSNGDPTFAELMGPGPDFAVDPWTKYCEAFA